jgi:hypothetical protein
MLYYSFFENSPYYIKSMPLVKIYIRKYMIAARIEVAPKAIIKITRNSFVVAITFGTLDSMTLNLIMGSLL